MKAKVQIRRSSRNEEVWRMTFVDLRLCRDCVSGYAPHICNDRGLGFRKWGPMVAAAFFGFLPI